MSPGHWVVVAVAMWVVASVWGSISLVGGSGREGLKMKHNYCLIGFYDVPVGPLISWVPCSPPPSPIPPSSEKEPPIPLERGGLAAACTLASEGAVMLVVKPTSLKGGEGLVARSTGKVRGGEGENQGVGGEVVVDKGTQ